MSNNSNYKQLIQVEEIQLTFDQSGHYLNQRQAFSPDDKKLVFDNRNDETKIGENSSVQVVTLETKEIETVYKLENQTAFGPGVGAVSFHPTLNQVVFIHGLMNASEVHPYGFTNRFAMRLELDHAKPAEPMEARDVRMPFTKGALRGGTHAYAYSADGQLVSFTYNDEILANESDVNPEVHDLRTVGAFLVGEQVNLEETSTDESFSGASFSILLAEVTASPLPGSDEISKAYEECWVGDAGYIKSDGSTQNRALAFLGDVVSASGRKVTEVFITDIPADIKALKNTVDAGSNQVLPAIPDGVKQRRLTFTTTASFPGVQGPRHWLRSSPDGSAIYFYQLDKDGIVQIFSVTPNGGEIIQITTNEFSADTTFGLSSDGKYLAYGSNEAIYVTTIADGLTRLVVPAPSYASSYLSNINWSNAGQILAYNRKVGQQGEGFYQLFISNLSNLFN